MLTSKKLVTDRRYGGRDGFFFLKNETVKGTVKDCLYIMTAAKPIPFLILAKVF